MSNVTKLMAEQVSVEYDGESIDQKSRNGMTGSCDKFILAF